MKVKTLLLWGVNDPWITMNRANKILHLLPSANFSPLQVSDSICNDSTREKRERKRERERERERTQALHYTTILTH